MATENPGVTDIFYEYGTLDVAVTPLAEQCRVLYTPNATTTQVTTTITTEEETEPETETETEEGVTTAFVMSSSDATTAVTTDRPRGVITTSSVDATISRDDALLSTTNGESAISIASTRSMSTSTSMPMPMPMPMTTTDGARATTSGSNGNAQGRPNILLYQPDDMYQGYADHWQAPSNPGFSNPVRSRGDFVCLLVGLFVGNFW